MAQGSVLLCPGPAAAYSPGASFWLFLMAGLLFGALSSPSKSCWTDSTNWCLKEHAQGEVWSFSEFGIRPMESFTF